MEYAYIRVSTKDQTKKQQFSAMSAFGISPQNIFMDKHSGKFPTTRLQTSSPKATAKRHLGHIKY